MFAAGVGTLLWPTARDMASLCVYAFSYGVFGGAWFALIPVVVAEYFGVRRLASILSLVFFGFLPGALASTPLAGPRRGLAGGPRQSAGSSCAAAGCAASNGDGTAAVACGALLRLPRLAAAVARAASQPCACMTWEQNAGLRAPVAPPHLHGLPRVLWRLWKRQATPERQQAVRACEDLRPHV